MDQMDWKEYRRPLVKQPWYPVVNTPDLDPTLTKIFLNRFGDPLQKKSLTSRDIIFEEEKIAFWLEAIEFGCRQLPPLFSEKFEISTKYYLTELTDVHVLLPFGIIWSEARNEYYSEPYMSSNARSSYLFLQSHYTDWKVLRSKWMPQPITVNTSIYWAYDTQYTNIFHYIHDNYWKLIKYKDFVSKNIIPKNTEFFSSPTNGSSYVDYFIDGAKLPRNLHRYYGHGHFIFKKLFVPMMKNSFPSTVNAGEGYQHRCFDEEYYERLADNFNVHDKSAKAAGLKLMLLREDALHRNIRNLSDVKKILAKYGFATYNPGRESIQNQIETFARASHIVALHGASLTNLVWCQKNLRLLEIMPIEHQNAGYRGIAASKKIDHFIMLAAMSEESASRARPPAYQDVVVDIEKLNDFLHAHSF